MRSVYICRMKEDKKVFKPLTGIEPHIFGSLLIRRVMLLYAPLVSLFQGPILKLLLKNYQTI